MRDGFRLLVLALMIGVVVPGTAVADGVFSRAVSLDSPPRALEAVLEGLQSVPVVDADFVERRHMQSLTRPLRSEGKLVFARNRGLYRRLTEPVEQEQFVGPNGLIVERLPDGEVNRMDLSGSPRGQFVALSFDLFAGRLNRDGSSMRVYFRGGADSWTIGIRPSSSNQRFLRWLKLAGRNRRITRMTMVHSTGDTTVTRFRNSTIQESLTSDQKAVFRGLKGE